MAVETGGAGGSAPVKPKKPEDVAPPVKPTFGASPNAGNDLSDVSSSAQGGLPGLPDIGSAPFTNPVGEDGQQLVPAAGTPAADLDNSVTAAIAGDTTQGSAGQGAPDTDWADVFWGSLGLPPDLVSQINAIFTQYPDASTAQAIAQNVIYGSTWFQQTFPGYANGVTAGLFSDVNGYRGYVNDMNALSQQYNQAPVSTADVVNNINAGLTSTHYGQTLQGAAYVNANQGYIQQEVGAFGTPGTGQGTNSQLSGTQLTSLGQEQAGIDTPLGQNLQLQVQKALQRMQGVFNGKVAGPAGLTVNQQGLNAPGLLGNAGANPGANVGAQ